MNDFDEFIRATRQEFEPSSEERARVRRRLLARAGGVGLVASVATKAGATYGSSALGGQSLAGLAKLFVASMAVTFAGGGAVVAVTRVLSSPSQEPQRSAVASSTATTQRAEPLPAPVTSANAHAVAERASAPPVTSGDPIEGARPVRSTLSDTAANAPSPAALEAELALLREARLASKRGDQEQAQRLLDALDQRHPRGALLEERSALRAITGCEAGGGTRAERAAEFLRRYPASVYVARVRRVCGSASNGEMIGPVPATSSSASFTGSNGAGH
ncbi:MAG TPA: hypothetical protein VGK73_36935 [Polyangiaceae bacterium]